MEMPGAARLWPSLIRKTADAMIDRGQSSMAVSHDLDLPAADCRDYRAWYRVNAMLWPGPRECAVALITAARLTHEDVIEAATAPGPSRARAYAFNALMTRYPGLDRGRLARALGASPLPGAAPAYPDTWAAQFFPNPYPRWWSLAITKQVAAAISQSDPRTPFPDPPAQPPSPRAGDNGQNPKTEPCAIATSPPLAKAALDSASSGDEGTGKMAPEKPAARALVPLMVCDDPLQPLGLIDCSDSHNLSVAGAATLALKSWQCRWPIGDPQTSDFRFCGVARRERDDPKKPYCARHSEMAGQIYRRSSPSKKAIAR